MLCKRVLERMRHGDAAVAFQWFSSITMAQKEQRQAVNMTIHVQLVLSRMRRAVQGWQAYLCEAKAQRKREFNLIRKVVRNLLHGKKASTLRRWVEMVRRGKSMHALAGKAVGRWRHQAVGACFTVWLANATTEARRWRVDERGGE